MIRTISLFEDSGDLIKKSTIVGSPLKEGWFVMYKDAIQQLVKEVPNFATLKVFVQLSSYQTFDTYVYVTAAQVARDLGLTYKTTWEAVKWLEDHKYLMRETIKGTKVFVMNHKVTTCGKASLGEKRRLWSIKLGDPPPAAPRSRKKHNEQR